ncbi:MAG: DNA-processing protein DprA [Acutalibacteraceae bacterium]|nr:DNA-processing protein DprA [Acutalibacteraceae bacterium]
MSVCPVEYWIWLQNALGAGARTDELLSYFKTPEEMYKAGEYEWRLSGLLTQRKIELLKNSTFEKTAEIINECRQKGYKIITPDDNLFPDRLKNLTDMPLVLYGVGDCSVMNDAVSIGMVGTRNASDYGIETAQKLSFLLALSGATIVSGGALGIDSEAHAGAMLAKGRTLAFLGCGLSVNYLMENASLRRAITRYGAVVSEYSPFITASRTTFPTRNRLISGVSLGVVVVEAGVKSGSLITANFALDQGKDVFAVPGDIVRSSFDGTNHLIKNGAKPVFTAEDILSEYEYLYGDLLDLSNAKSAIASVPYVDYRKKKPKAQSDKIKKEPAIKPTEKTVKKIDKKTLPEDMSEEAKIVYSVLNENGVHIDDIVRETNLKMNIVLSSLTELELLDFVQLENGKKYKII